MDGEILPRDKWLLARLRTQFYPSMYWLFVCELRTSTGFTRDMQRIDALAIHLWPSAQYKREAYEVKLTRSDFLREIKQPQKRKLALLYSNTFYFLAPQGLIKPAELPVECGLREVRPDGIVETTVWAPHRDGHAPTWGFMLSVLRHQQAAVELEVRLRLLREAAR